jgi:hypothetical protein
MANKVDSNVTGLSFAEEETLKTLPVTPIWYPLEPNSYSDFGGQITTIARNPINPTRQRKKGVTTDLDASGGFNQDLTFSNTTRLLQGFFFADIHEKFSSAPMNDLTPVVMTAIAAAADDYTAAAGLSGILSGALLFASGFGVAANNGLKVANGASSATAASVSDALADEATPPAAAKIQVVGYQFTVSTVDIVMSGSLVRLSRVSGAFDMTTLGLTVGEWVFLGGDGATLTFANNVGFARVSVINAAYLEFDKVTWTPQAEVGTGDTVQVFFGSFLRNEPDSDDIVRRTYNVERQLGEDDDGVMSEYLVGAVANEMSMNIPQADKLNIDLSFVATDNEQRTGLTGIKSGTRVDLDSESAYNTSSDFARIQLSLVDATDSTVAPLFAYCTELTLTVNNNVTPNKAVGTLGAFDTSAGTFEVGGSLTAYFADITAVQAVRNNSDVTLDFSLVKDNKGILVDVPLIALGDGRLSVEQDQPITLPLETNAAQSDFGYTLLMMSFPYLPNVA